jgi:NTE family protein/lysophospholipid hydrolase
VKVATTFAVASARGVEVAEASVEEAALLNAARFRQRQLMRILTSLFGNDRQPLDVLRAELVWHHLAAGEVLFRQGDSADSMFVVVTGRFRILAEDALDGQRVVAEVAAGEMLGEFALLTNDVRSATAYAIRDTDVVEFSRSLFERVIETNPQFLLRITRMVVQRAKIASGTSPRHNTTATNFVLVAADSSRNLTDFAHRLERALGMLGRTLHLNSESFDRAFGAAGAAQLANDHHGDIAVMSWLGEQEARYDYVVYETDRTWTPWTERCLRQADRILIVADAAGPTQPGPVEQQVARCLKVRPSLPTDLVLLHHDRQHVPTRTRSWLHGRSLTQHHHIVDTSNAEVQRLARVLTRRAVGLVLGGGGARGFAHIGAIRALREAGVPIDFVGGTSIGSCIGAQYAMGMDWQPMLQLNRRGFVEMNPMADYTLPVIALLSTHKLGRVLEMMFGDVHIEDLWLPYFCISTNLSRGQMMVHQEGLVRKYARASMAVPGVAPPVSDNGSLLIDGGVLNNLPVDVMREPCQDGYVIAVDVSPRVEFVAPTDYRENLSGWYVAWRRLNPFGPRWRVPTIQAILQRTTSLAGRKRGVDAANRIADLYMHPPVEGFGMFEARALDRIADIGYRTAQVEIAQWKDGKSF